MQTKILFLQLAKVKTFIFWHDNKSPYFTLSSTMKKIFLAAFLILVLLNVTLAQNILITPNDSIAISANSTDEWDILEAHIHIVNNTPNATTYTWRMTGYTAPVPPWELKLCDNHLCYDLLIGNPVHVSYPVNAYDSMDMKFQFSPHCVAGTGDVNVSVYDNNDSTNTIYMLNYRADFTVSCPSAVPTIAKSSLKIFPNPVQNIFTVSGLENAGNLAFEVYDLKGVAVPCEVKTGTGSAIHISVEKLPAGVYVLKAFDKAGNMTGTARLTKVD